MAKKNRKKRKLNALMMPAPLAGLIVLLVAFALGYIWLGCRCEALGRELKGLETERDALRKQHLNEEFKWSRMKSPREIEKALEMHHIVMTWPSNEQVIRLSDSNVLDEPVSKEDDDALQFARLERMILHE